MMAKPTVMSFGLKDDTQSFLGHFLLPRSWIIPIVSTCLRAFEPWEV